MGHFFLQKKRLRVTPDASKITPGALKARSKVPKKTHPRRFLGSSIAQRGAPNIHRGTLYSHKIPPKVTHLRWVTFLTEKTASSNTCPYHRGRLWQDFVRFGIISMYLDALGRLLGVSCSLLGSLGRLWDAFWALSSDSWAFMKVFGCLLGTSSALCGCSWGILRVSWAPVGHSWGILGA